MRLAPLGRPDSRDHIAALGGALAALEADARRLERWGRRLASTLARGGRLLAAGNGGSASEAQHLTSELVGRYRDERQPFSALALTAESSSLTAIANDYGADAVFARQVRAHGRPGDVLIALSTSGRSPNVLAAADAARERGLTVWALTGAPGNPLARAADEALCVDAADTATVQEIHLVAIHLLCSAFDAALQELGAAVTPAGALAAAPAGALRPAAARPGGGERRPARLVVVGDALLDRDLDGHARRLAPDAPVPVLEDLAERPRPGGAGLAAALARGAGCAVTLICALGNDLAGHALRELLDAAGVTVCDLGSDGPTAEKIRVRAGGRALLRLDAGGAPGRPGPLDEAGRAALTGADAVLVSDYGRGVAAEPSVRAALGALPGTVPIVWDPHPRGAEPVHGCVLVTPNTQEAALLARDVRAGGSPPDDGAADPGTAEDLGRSLREKWRAVDVCVTLGARGALLVGAGGPALALPATVATGGDPCGAGDCFAATAAARLAGGALPSAAVAAAVDAASAFVAGGGAGDAARRGFGLPAPAAPEDARALAARVRAAGGTVVATGGCFDLLHTGHVEMLRAARALGDCLVVCLNSDASVRRLKGPERPLVAEADRAAVLLGLECVDAVAVFDEDDPRAVLRILRPHLWVKGGDYAVGDLPEAETLQDWDGRAVIVPYMAGRSTSGLIERATARSR
jgi:rfaE bifunctional protein nucleotidyltransferase chain/domain/rfaE bifunctional protein kinase chain/domain